jgi:hypothetical protein
MDTLKIILLAIVVVVLAFWCFSDINQLKNDCEAGHNGACVEYIVRMRAR